MPRHTSVADPSLAVEAAPPRGVIPVRVVIVTLDNHLASTVERAAVKLREQVPGLVLSMHAATDWNDPEALARCHADIERGDIVVATMLFMDQHVKAVEAQLAARRDHCDAMVCIMSAPEIMKLTRMGRFSTDKPASGPMAWLKKLRGNVKPGAGAGKSQVAILKRLPQILRYIPGKAQDVRAWFLTLQYWIAGSEANVVSMVSLLIERYASEERATLRERVHAEVPVEYPETGLYHPDAEGRVVSHPGELPGGEGPAGTVGVLLMRSYVLAGNTLHYDAVLRALEGKGFRVLPAFASGLDGRPAIEAFFKKDGEPVVDAVVSLTGFSLVGGPAYNDADAAESVLADLDVPYLSALAVEFQNLGDWRASELGLTPVESTIMVSIPELDGTAGVSVFGGRCACGRNMTPDPERVERLAERTARLVALRRKPRAERKLSIVLFNFPPNGGATGTAAYLGVYASLLNTLRGLAREGYTVDVPEDEEALRARILEGNAEQNGTDCNVVDRISADDHVRREPYLSEIEAEWGPAPGKAQSDGRSILVLGARFGNVLVGVQPTFGYEGDPMRLLFESSFAPTHAFSAFYRYLRDDFGSDAILHFGTHGALEFMPGKQVGLSADCWPERLIGSVPNIYLYAANNPSEGTIAKRRSAATLVSYLTPSVARAGLYKGLVDLKDSLNRWRRLPAAEQEEAGDLLELIQAQAAELELAPEEPAWTGRPLEALDRLWNRVIEIEDSLIPDGLHVLGEAPSAHAREELVGAMAETVLGDVPPAEVVHALLEGGDPAAAAQQAGIELSEDAREALRKLPDSVQALGTNHEVDALLHALDGRYIRPAPGGDLLRTPEILPTGRNLHGFDPFRLPSTYAVRDGARQAELLLERLRGDLGEWPESVAMVLWGTDNLKSEGAPIGQALALLGARPRFDAYGRLAGAELIDLETLGRPRIDVVLTLSGIFRDLLPLQVRLLAEAALLAARADEPLDRNYVRAHTLAEQERLGCDFETAALRVFSNAQNAYGANVNQLIDDGRWQEESELGEAFAKRKSFAYGADGATPRAQAELFGRLLGNVRATYQNLESVENGITSLDHYFDSLGGISRAVSQARGEGVPVYVGDQTRGRDQLRTLADQVALETRTRMLNPRWYEGLLQHGYEGVRQIELHVTNTMGLSATTGQVEPWVYDRLTETFVLDEAMRERLAALNPKASIKMADRLLEASERQYWNPDPETLEALLGARDQLEDRLEGVAA